MAYRDAAVIADWESKWLDPDYDFYGHHCVDDLDDEDDFDDDEDDEDDEESNPHQARYIDKGKQTWRGETVWECSKCGQEFMIDRRLPNWCPNCGRALDCV